MVCNHTGAPKGITFLFLYGDLKSTHFNRYAVPGKVRKCRKLSVWHIKPFKIDAECLLCSCKDATQFLAGNQADQGHITRAGFTFHATGVGTMDGSNICQILIVK